MKKMSPEGRYYNIEVVRPAGGGEPYALRLINNIQNRVEKTVIIQDWGELYFYTLSQAQMKWLDNFAKQHKL